MNIEYGYLDVLKELVHKGTTSTKRDDRTGTGTFSKFGVQLKHDMNLGFPLLTTKKVHFKSIVSELLWFMRGQTDLRTLLLDDNTIWVGDAYKRYLREGGQMSKSDFINEIINDDIFSEYYGQLGAVYGAQWRGIDFKRNPDLVSWLCNKGVELKEMNTVDQLQNAVDLLRNEPESRRIIVDAWNPNMLKHMLLPPCHLYFQLYIEPLSKQEQKKLNTTKTKKLSLLWMQRSCDFFLGGAFNIGSYAVLLELLSEMVGAVPAELVWNIGDTHLYSDHINPAKIQTGRIPFDLPKLKLSDKIKFNGTVDEMLESIIKNSNNDYSDFIDVDGYMSHSGIKAPLSN